MVRSHIRSHIRNSLIQALGKPLLFSSILLMTVAFPLAARADLQRICTRNPGSSVTLRTGPGISYPRGLNEVGSGGAAVDRYFRQRNYTVQDGEQISVFTTQRGTDGQVWYQVGTNQWVAWVRSDFVCSPEPAE